MPTRHSGKAHRPRELRRRVVMPARLLDGVAWTDACILNISSRGMLIHTGRPMAKGTEVEVRRGDHVIPAHVVWRDGGRVGLKAEDRIPVEEIVTLGKPPAPEGAAAPTDRRTQRRSEDHRRRGRAIEFVGVVAIAVTLAVAGASLMFSVFAAPLALVADALPG